MHFVYIDDSGDEKLAIFSALIIPENHWQECFQRVKSFRQDLKSDHGIYVRKELHAWKFVSGRGKCSDRTVTKYERSEIFKSVLDLVAGLPEVRLLNACYPPDKSLEYFGRVLNRVNRTMQAWDSHAVIISDEGKEQAYTRLARRMGVFNPIPSRYGMWEQTGTTTKNIPIKYVLEDIVFKDSRRSYFVQLADFAAYALLRRENPIPSKTKYGIHEAFNLLAPILLTEATNKDPEGILRGKKRAAPESGSS